MRRSRSRGIPMRARFWRWRWTRPWPTGFERCTQGCENRSRRRGAAVRNLPELVNRTLARVAKPRLPLFGRDWCSFHVTGAAGLVLTAATGLLLASMLNRSVAVMAAVIGVALVCLWTLL